MIALLYGAFEGVWRRLFGGDRFPRWLLHLINIVATGGLLLLLGHSLLLSAVAVAVYEGFYWSVGHGPAFDMGRDGQPTPELLKRYKKYFWNKLCEKLVPVEDWYGFWYDSLWLFFRYEIPAVIVAVLLLSPVFIFAGPLVTLAYSIGWELSERGFLKKLAATELAEIIAGFVTGVLLCH